MIDVETRARRAGEAARAEATERARGMEALPTVWAARGSRRSIGRRPLVGALAGVAIVLLVVVLGGQLAQPRVPTIEPAVPDLTDLVEEPVAVDGELPVPPVGEAIPAYLEDGTPVFVSHPEDGEVYVLEAFDGHGPGGIREMVHWCPTSGQFEEARHSTRFNGYGDYAGGPAPHALRDVPSEAVDDDTVRVTGPPGPARERADVRSEEPMRGPPCLDTDYQLTARAVSHEQPVDVPALDGSALPRGRWLWAQVRLGGPEGDPRVCELDGRCPVGAPRAGVDAWQTPTFDSEELATLLVRGDGSQAVLAVGPDPARSGAVPWDGYVTRSLPIPDPGHAALEQLPDGSPVVVSHEADGGLHVLEAARPDSPDLVASCPAAGILADSSGAAWSLGGVAASQTDAGDLRAYPFEVVEADDARAIRVTGVTTPTPSSDRSTEDVVGGCPGELQTHRPSSQQPVADRLSPLTDTEPDVPAWRWVEARVTEIDGQLVLCAYLGPDRCGEPVPTDDTTADCYADLPTGGICADRDPVIVTPGVSSTDGPVLMLARLASDGRTVEVRFPAGSDGG